MMLPSSFAPPQLKCNDLLARVWSVVPPVMRCKLPMLFRHGDRKPHARRRLLPVLFAGLFVACVLLLSNGISSITTSSFLITSAVHEPKRARLQFIELESPILKSVRPVAEQVPHEEDSPLNRQLHRIRDTQNWRLLGDVHSTGQDIYNDRKTKRFLNNEANIAFFVQISKSNILLVPRLLSRIWHPQNIYCIHFDAKIPLHETDMFIRAIKSNAKLSNVFILPSVPVTYQGISMLLNTLESIDALLRISGEWEYYINISGSDYPLVSATGIRRLLGSPTARDSSVNFVHFSNGGASWAETLKHRLGTLHFDLSLGFNDQSDEKLVEIRALPHPVLESEKLKIEVAKGAAWIIGHRTFCEYAAYGNVARRLITLFANMQSTPEHFFQTLAWNHKDFNKTTARYSFREIVWSFKGELAGSHPFYLDRQSKSGSWEVWPVLQYSPDFFARKFQIPDSNLLEHIDIQKSGATDKQANMTAVSRSFAIVKNRFWCVADIYSSLRKQHMNPCFWSGWRQYNCRQNQEELCPGDFLEPPV